MQDTGRWRWETFRDAEFIRKTLIGIALVVLVLLFWRIADVLLLAFGAILVAVILHAFADVLERYVRVPSRWSLTVASLTIFLIVIGLLALFGAQIRVQFANVAERLPFAIDNFSKELGLGAVTDQLPQMLGAGTGMLSRIAGIGGVILGGLTDFVLVVIAGLYIAASPRIYRTGLVKLFPPSQHERVEGSLEAVGRALKLWLVSQLIAMTCVAVLTGVSLWLIGVPYYFALGLIAGLVDFIPFIGPIIGAVPAILIAFTVDGNTVLWTIVAFIVIQQIEGNVIFPIVERRVVAVPPALALFAIVAAGAIFGTLGIVFGFPLAVVAFVLVKKLYVRETLGESTDVPGEKEAEAPQDEKNGRSSSEQPVSDPQGPSSLT
jgi:predicted PurR-regulated permease PerM